MARPSGNPQGPWARNDGDPVWHYLMSEGHKTDEPMLQSVAVCHLELKGSYNWSNDVRWWETCPVCARVLRGG